MGLPVIPFGTPQSLDTDPAALDLLARGPVARVRFGADGPEGWLVLGYQAARQVMTDPRFSREAAMTAATPKSSTASDAPDVLSNQDAPNHTRVRRLMAKAFTPRRVDAFAPTVQRIIDQLLDDVEAHGAPADLLGLFAAPLPIKVICELMGVPDMDVTRMRDWAEKLMAVYLYSPEQILAAQDDLQAYLNELIEHKRANLAEDVTTALVQARDEGDRLSHAELVINLQSLLVAGHETTVNQLANGIVTLSRHPEQFDKLKADLDLVPGAVHEIMRYVKFSNADLPRTAVEDVELGGQLIRAGDTVTLPPHMPNRDPEAFENPNVFDVTRANADDHLSFTYGPHYCLGAHLANTELRLALRSVLARFPKLQVAVPDDQLVWKDGMIVRALRELPVSW
ncbi:cytochrome P450 [Kutzneria sp. CA-103260]|uniref:cytochrome P450 n=1 Tax=Kutzneria sp. CA-103260 TaxID=2802641 RepID=UPI001BAAB2AE|nr:cytochrome P450 [Kutzneria sp. CA-103260]QUQ70179.1 cytochrome P450 [Kutzneria sp. CA-103260]